jgi:hypothetical protein
MSTILPSTYNEGTVAVANGSASVVGVGTMWLNTILPGDFFAAPSGLAIRVLDVVDNTHLTLAYVWPGASLAAGSAYEIRFQADMARMQETSRQLLQKLMNGNIEAFSGLVGANGTIPMFTGPGAMTLLDKTDLINGVRYDVQVNTLADRVAYDTQVTGFTVLVSDIGDGRAAVYSKKTNASGDWTNPAYITGVKGDTGLNWRGNWDNATAYVEDDAVFYNNASWIALVANTNVAPVAGATWGQLAARGAPGVSYTSRGTYSGATAYVVSDTVLYNGSTYVCIANTTGNAPPNPPTTINTWWQLLALKGTDGTGTGDVVGPSGVTDDLPAFFNGATGKLIKSKTKVDFKTWLAATGADVSFDNSAIALANSPATVQAALAELAKLRLQGSLYGLTLSNNVSDATNDIDIAAGLAASDTSPYNLMTLASALTKRLDASWVVGNNQGGLDTGVIQNATYHIWLIQRSDTGVVDSLFSLSPSAPTMPTNYDRKRRIGSVVRSSGTIQAFTQRGDEFFWKSPVIDVNATNPGTSTVNRTLSVPTGIQVTAIVSTWLFDTGNIGASLQFYLSSLDQNDIAAGGTLFTGAVVTPGGTGNISASAMANIRTNTSATIRSNISASGAGTVLRIVTHGYLDTRGRL